MKTALLLLLACALPLSAAQRVTLCEVVADPAAFDRREIEVAAFVSHGFEDFTLFDPRCADANARVWVEYGGRFASGTIYCCGPDDARSRSEALEVDGIETKLVDDRTLKQFDRLLRREGGAIVHATLRGRFFSGDGGTTWTGYGHFGLFSLFVIEQVVSVDAHDLRDVDYRSAIDEPELAEARCFSQPFDLSDAEAIELQRQADAGPRAWSFTDPLRVATEQLQQPGLRLRVVRKTRGSISYRAGANYRVVVSRPYWLTFFAADRRRVAWVPVAVYDTKCKE